MFAVGYDDRRFDFTGMLAYGVAPGSGFSEHSLFWRPLLLLSFMFRTGDMNYDLTLV